MDAVGLVVLLEELAADAAVVNDAAHKAALRLTQTEDGRLEACAFELARLYNTFERSLVSICASFENNFEKRGTIRSV